MNIATLGLDFGGVLRLETTGEPCEHAADMILALEQRFTNNIWIVSRTDTEAEESEIREWLKGRSFLSPVLIPEQHLRFCRQRKEKAGICRELGITHFVDNRPEVLHYMQGVVPITVLFRPDPYDLRRWPKTWIGPFQHWSEIFSVLQSE